MSDPRPALTARWRELERKGWKFSLTQSMCNHGYFVFAQNGNKIAYTESPYPFTDASEEKLVNWFEQYIRKNHE